jgi:predicted nucleotide-binding protein (sugar kinase/HSP70/actin superfamily)
MKHWEKKLMEAASPFLDDRHEPRFQSVGRAIKFAQQGAAMVVNFAPFGCMPETVAAAIFGRVSADVDMPI